MAVDTLIHSFCIGELSFAALARVDMEKTRLGAKIQENLLPFVVGRAMMRPGFQYLGNSASNNKARGIEFVKSVANQAYAGLELTNQLLRVWYNDQLVTRNSVGTTITGGTFPNSTGWLITSSGGGSATFSGSLTLVLPNRGGSIAVDQQVTVASGDRNVEQALRIIVAWGPVNFQAGSSQGADDYIQTTALDTGQHSLALTPTGNYWIRFSTTRDVQCIVTSIAVESAGVMTLPAPWQTADLFQIQYAQSADIVYLAHPNWQQQLIERRGNHSWSVCLYKAVDGPFALPGPSDSSITITPGANVGNTTLTASSSLFLPTDVESLFSVDSTGYNATWNLGAQDAVTEPIRIFGIVPSTGFRLSISGTWSGVITLELSLEGPYTGFAPTAGVYSSNQLNIPVDPGTPLNNIVLWYRLHFTTYNSGVATCSFLWGASASVGSPAGNNNSVSTVSANGTGIYRVTGYNSPTSVNVEVLQYPTSLSGSQNWRRAQWSATNGWPTAVKFHDGRLWWGSAGFPIGSASDNFTSFALETAATDGVLSVTDSDSIQVQIATSGAVYNLNWMVSLMRLVIGTDGAEVSARSDAFDAPLTPTSCQLKNCSLIGSSAVSPITFDKEAFYVNRSGNRVYKLFYNFAQYDYDSDDLTEMNTDIGTPGLTQLAMQRNPEPWVWIVRADGQLLLLLYSIKHQITGWFRMLSLGSSGTDVIESCYVLPGLSSDLQDRLYVWVNRTINGQSVRYLEKMSLVTEGQGAATTKLADAGSFFAGPASSVTAAQLANCTGLVGWGTTGGVSGPILNLSANGSGVISLGATYTNIWVGLPYTGRYQSARLAYGAGNNTALLMNKRVPIIGLLASYLAHDGLTYGPANGVNFNAPFSLLSKTQGQTVSPGTIYQTYEENPWPFSGQWMSDSRVCLEVAPGYPATLNGLIVGVETDPM